jgi:hypothetical protein
VTPGALAVSTIRNRESDRQEMPRLGVNLMPEYRNGYAVARVRLLPSKDHVTVSGPAESMGVAMLRAVRQ